MEQALYLKYRPQVFSDLDVSEVREFFMGLLKSGRVPHAFLLTGPRGTGKTSTARIIAKLVNCEKNLHFDQKGKLLEPCGKCDACSSITNGSALDVIEVDAASNRGIDDVRELREKVKLAPTSLPYKVFIVDECHMLTTEASNALLKTLEEPPKHTIFVLCTTESHKVLPTIVSRCVRIIFRRAKDGEVVEKLTRVVRDEKIEISQKALEMVAKGGGGSFRDAVKLLEQLTLSGEKITDKVVEEFLGQQESGKPGKLLQLMSEKDLKGAIEEVNFICESGIPMRVFIEGVLEQLRNEILFLSGVGDKEGKRYMSGLSLSQIVSLARKFEEAGRQLKDAVLPQLPLELLVVEWCAGDTLLKSSGGSKKEELSVPVAKMEEKVEAAPIVAEVAKEGDVSIGEIEAKWQEILKEVRPKNHSVEALLRSSKPIGVNGNSLELEVFYKFHKERLETDKCRRIVEDSISNLMGRHLRIVCKLGEGKRMKTDTAVVENISGAAVDEDILKAAEEIFGVEAI